MTDVDYARVMIESSIVRLENVVQGLRYTNVDYIADYVEEIIFLISEAYKALEEEKEDGWEV